MKTVLYIGNKLNNFKSNTTSIQQLGLLFEDEGYTLYYASDVNNKFFRLIDMLSSVFKYGRKVDYVLIDTYSTLNFYFSFFVSLLCHLCRIRYIPILRGGNLPSRLENYPFVSKLIFKNAYISIAPSLYLKKAFKKYNFNNIVYIPNTIKIENYKFSKKSYKKVSLLWVRSFSEIYNPTLAVKIVKQLQDDGLNVELCMVGPDSDGSLNKVKELAKKLQVDVKFTGKLSKLEWRELAKDYNIFINTTNFDNMPVSVIEAMALGLNIVSTNVGGMPYLIANNVDGLLVPKNDKKAFVKAIKDIFKSPETSSIIALKARQKVEQFDWDIVKHKWFNVLK